MTGLLIAVTLIGAYLLGSIPTAYIIGKFRKGTDIREVGSKNMGAMNVIYNVGFWWGALVLAIDIGKGVIAMFIAKVLNIPELAYYATGVVVILGHNFPVFLKFRGGKGGATAVGVLSYVDVSFWISCGVRCFCIVNVDNPLPDSQLRHRTTQFSICSLASLSQWALDNFCGDCGRNTLYQIHTETEGNLQKSRESTPCSTTKKSEG